MRIRRRRTALALAMMAVLCGCQATTHQGASTESAKYPPLSGSPGITDSKITVAVIGVTNRQSTLWTSYSPVYAALQKDLEQYNADGGVAGRKLATVPMYDGAKGNEKSIFEATRSICDLAVRQRHSFVTQGQASFSSTKELEQAGCVGSTRTVNVLRTALIKKDELAESPDLVAPYALDDVTASRTLVRRLAAQGFFKGATRVGVVNPGGDYAATINNVLVKELARLGIKNPFVLIGKGDEGTQAEASSDVLKLKAAKVDRVVFLNDSQGGSLLRLAQAMVGQKYTPPFGTLNNVYPEYLINLKYPAHQVHVVSTLGNYAPTGSGDPLPGLPKTPASKRCTEAAAGTGQKIDPTTTYSLLTGCDTLGLTVEALKASGAKQPSTAAFFDGLSKLTKFDSAFGIPLDFSHGRAGASQVWDLKGDDACGCLKVASGPHPVSRG
ncbi:ABC transporter substrate-binding protein [Streptomyces sp. NPDC001508]|uniref:ABC transporter substrate-binding protein n=1 Tax=Streptomyces sp. NPDC001508 TaxID=3154656 RepID=UPI00331B8DBF